MSANDIELKVKVMDGDDLVVKCELTDTVKVLKERIEKETSIPVNEQKLIYRGRMLTNDKTLSESSLEDHCAIFLVKQKPKENEPVTETNTEPTPEPSNQTNGNGIPNVMNPLLETINSAIGSLVNTISANTNQPGHFQFTPAPTTNAPSSNANSTPSHDNSDAILDEVLNGTSSSAHEATEANPAPESATQPAETNSQPASTSSNDAQQLTERLMRESQRLMSESSTDVPFPSIFHSRPQRRR